MFIIDKYFFITLILFFGEFNLFTRDKKNRHFFSRATFGKLSLLLFAVVRVKRQSCLYLN